MTKIVPVKNIDKVLVDIKKPNFNYEVYARKRVLHLERLSMPKRQRTRLGKRIVLWGALFAVFVLIFASTIAYFNLENIHLAVRQNSGAIIDNFRASLFNLRNLQPREAANKLKQNTEEVQSLSNVIKKSGGQVLIDALSPFIPGVKNSSALLSSFTKLNLNFLELIEAMADLQDNGFRYFRSNGAKLLALLRSVSNSIEKILAESQTIKQSTAALKSLSPFFSNLNEKVGGLYLKHVSDLYQIQGFVNSLLTFLETPEEKHLAIFFQNPAELRPAGGFIGSYADLTFSGGQMHTLDVRDIYDPDGQFNLKIIPPWPLQTMTTDWEARDANWFFDFPTSAKTVIDFLEKSKIYEERNIRFEGAIALNINVLVSIMKLIGPQYLADYNLVIDENNFQREIQREVEAGKDKLAGEPKRILKILTPIILEKLDNLLPKERQELVKTIQNHIAKKDIMIFMKNGDLGGFLKANNLDGSVFELPLNFFGSYLAVVNANVAGGKSDAFINQEVEARIEIDREGGTLTDLTVRRTHSGDKEKDPWWRALNQNFIQIFTNPDSTLLFLSGNNTKTNVSNFDYQTENYKANPDLDKIEKTRVYFPNHKTWALDAFGKKVFATWFNTPAGKTSVLTVRYQSAVSAGKIIVKNQPYQFIFDKQSGVKTSLKVTFVAPLGYEFAESGSSFYTYESHDPDSRVILNLTLVQ